jgi:hypothetical protein
VSEHDDWQEAQYHDEQQLQRAALDALHRARTLGLEESECMAIAYSAGIANDFYKELRREP